MIIAHAQQHLRFYCLLKQLLSSYLVIADDDTAVKLVLFGAASGLQQFSVTPVLPLHSQAAIDHVGGCNGSTEVAENC